MERKAADLKSKITRLVDAIAHGAGEFQEVKDRLRTARADLAGVQQPLAAMDEAVPLELSSNLADRYRLYIAELHAALSTDGAARERAAFTICELVDTVTLIPNAEGREVEIQVAGRMGNIINLAKNTG